MTASTPETLQYFISNKNSIVVVSFAGSLDRESPPVLERCLAEIGEAQPKWVILYMRDISNRVELVALPAFAKLQKMIREFPADLRLCSLHPEFAQLLVNKGLLRLSEVTNNLPDALKSLK